MTQARCPVCSTTASRRSVPALRTPCSAGWSLLPPQPQTFGLHASPPPPFIHRFIRTPHRLSLPVIPICLTLCISGGGVGVGRGGMEPSRCSSMAASPWPSQVFHEEEQRKEGPAGWSSRGSKGVVPGALPSRPWHPLLAPPPRSSLPQPPSVQPNSADPRPPWASLTTSLRRSWEWGFLSSRQTPTGVALPSLQRTHAMGTASTFNRGQRGGVSCSRHTAGHSLSPSRWGPRPLSQNHLQHKFNLQTPSPHASLVNQIPCEGGQGSGGLPWEGSITSRFRGTLGLRPPEETGLETSRIRLPAVGSGTIPQKGWCLVGL